MNIMWMMVGAALALFVSTTRSPNYRMAAVWIAVWLVSYWAGKLVADVRSKVQTSPSTLEVGVFLAAILCLVLALFGSNASLTLTIALGGLLTLGVVLAVWLFIQILEQDDSSKS